MIIDSSSFKVIVGRKVSCPSKGIFLLFPQKGNPPTLYTHRGGYMVDGYEMGSYERSLMSLRYSLICILITMH